MMTPSIYPALLAFHHEFHVVCIKHLKHVVVVSKVFVVSLSVVRPIWYNYKDVSGAIGSWGVVLNDTILLPFDFTC